MVCVSRFLVFGFWLLYFVAHVLVCDVLLSISCLVHFPILFLCCYACSPVLMCPLCACFVLSGFSFVFILYFFPWTILCRLFVVCILGYGLWALDISSLVFCLPACLCVCIWVLAIFAKLNILYLNPTRAKGQKVTRYNFKWRLKTYKVAKFPFLWFAEIYFANICSDDNMTLSLPTSLHLW